MSRTSLNIKNCLALLSSVLLGACNHIFYQPDQISYHQPKDIPAALEELSIPTIDGHHIHAWLISKKLEPKGLVLHFHGNAQNLSAHIAFSYWLVEQGFSVLIFDYRGYGRSLGIPSREGTLADSQAVIRYLNQEQSLAPLPKIVLAQSLGGAVAIPALASETLLGLKLLVIDSSFSSYRQIARLKLNQLWLTWPLQYPLSLLVSSGIDPIDSIAKLQGSYFLFVHSLEDPVVPFAASQDLFQAAPEPKDFWRISAPYHLAAFAEPHSKERKRLIELFESLTVKN